MSMIFLRVDYLDQDYDRAHEFPDHHIFSDWDMETGNETEYIWAKTTEEEAARIMGSRWEEYMNYPDVHELICFL